MAGKKKKNQLKLTKTELEHLRDLMNVRFPQDKGLTVSESLAQHEDRAAEEMKLWSKVHSLCSERGIALDDEAPDHVISLNVVDPYAKEGEGDEEDDA